MVLMPEKTTTISRVYPPSYYERRNYGVLEAHIDIPAFGYTELDETISYENVGRQRMTNCVHTKKTAIPFPSSGSHVDQDNPSQYVHSGNYGVAWGDLTSYTAYTIPGWNSTTTHDFVQRASRALIPSLSGKFALPTFLIDLVESKRLFSRWFSKKDSILKKAAKTHLSLQFGLFPLISDIEKLYQLLQDTRQRVSEFKRLLNKPVTLHYAEEGGATLPANVWLPNGSHLHKEVNYSWLTRPKMCATLKGIASCPAADLAYSDVLGMLDALGLNLNPRIVWDAIPFSFVVDWFFDIGKRLNEYRQDNLDVTLIVHDFCISQKFEYEYLQYWQLGPNEAPTLLWRGTYKRYERIRCLPDFSPISLRGTIPGFDKVLLGGALFEANRH